MSWLRKFSVLYHTLRYLKPVQIYYQLWYRIKAPFIRKFAYSSYFTHNIYPLKFNNSSLIVFNGKINGNVFFTFLNLSHCFPQSVDWNFMDLGRLWNYNLQYFDYLFDPLQEETYKHSLIEDFSAKLLNHEIKPEPYPVSLRIVNWILYFSQSGYTSPIFEKALKFQIDYLENNLEYHILANHLLENLLSLSIASVCLKDNYLRDNIFLKLKVQLVEQILDDGGHYECSPMYHEIILSKLLVLVEVLQKNDHTNTHLLFLEKTASKMLGWLIAFCFKDETYAFVNDSAKGISPGLGILKNAAKNLGVSPAQTTLKDCGYRKINKGDYEILVDTGNIKPNYQPGHAHSDALNFCIYYKGAPLIVDTGTSTYDLNKTRKEERSTAAHNTVLYNDLEPTQTWGAFRVGKRALVSIIIDEKNTLEAQHNGYKSYGIIHNRNFFFEENEIIIKDYLFCNCSNTGQAYIHFDHACEKPIQSGNTVTISDKCNILFENYVKIETLTYKHANGFNQFKSAYYLKISFIDKLVTKIRLY